MFDDFAIALVPVTSTIVVFAFLIVVVWMKQRRREREAYYRHELAKQLAAKGVGEEALLQLWRAENTSALVNRREGLKLAGLILMAIGGGFVIAFRWIGDDINLIGVIPLLMGLAMLVYAYFLSPSAPPNGADQ